MRRYRSAEEGASICENENNKNYSCYFLTKDAWPGMSEFKLCAHKLQEVQLTANSIKNISVQIHN